MNIYLPVRQQNWSEPLRLKIIVGLAIRKLLECSTEVSVLDYPNKFNFHFIRNRLFVCQSPVSRCSVNVSRYRYVRDVYTRSFILVESELETESVVCLVLNGVESYSNPKSCNLKLFCARFLNRCQRSCWRLPSMCQVLLSREFSSYRVTAALDFNISILDCETPGKMEENLQARSRSR